MLINGVYNIDANNNAHLIELSFDCPPKDVNLSLITQEIEGLSKDCWQSPWDEKYLDENGEEIIGDFFHIPNDRNKTRMIFYLHFIDFTKPLLTQFGQLSLTTPIPIPARLSKLTKYEEPD